MNIELNGTWHDMHVLDTHIVVVCKITDAHPVTALTTLSTVLQRYEQVSHLIRNTDTPPTVTVVVLKGTDIDALAGLIMADLNIKLASDFRHTCTQEMVEKNLALSDVPLGTRS